MRGPIDFIIVGFDGNKFDGSIMAALKDAIDQGTIALIALSLIVKNKHGQIDLIDATELNEDYGAEFPAVKEDDINEVADLLDNDSSAGLMIIEHLWARPLKRAIADAGGYLVADGRIHPEAMAELALVKEGV